MIRLAITCRWVDRKHVQSEATMSTSSDIPKQRFKIRYGELLIDGIHVEGVMWRLRFAIKNQDGFAKPTAELVNSLAQIGIQVELVEGKRVMESICDLPDGPAGFVCLLDSVFYASGQQQVKKRLFIS